MIPTHALRLQSMIRSMSEVIVPAIGPENQLARDQAAIVLANLQVLLDQRDRSYLFLLRELREYRDLAQRLREAAGAVEEDAPRTRDEVTMSEVNDLLDAALPSPEALESLVHASKARADRLAAQGLESKDPGVRERIKRLVLEQSAEQIERERSWFRSTGFDAGAGALASIDAVLGVRGGAETR